MGTKTLALPEDALVKMLRSLPEDILLDLFWKTVVVSDAATLTKEEKGLIAKGKSERKKGETVKWQDLR